MQYAKNAMELDLAHVCQIISAIHTVVVDRNVLPTMTVHAPKPVWTTNATIHVLVFAVQMLSAVWLITRRSVHALMVSQEIHWPVATNHRQNRPVRISNMLFKESPWTSFIIASTTNMVINIIMSLIIKLVRDQENPCVPSPCGANSQCRVFNEHAVCSCTPGYIGSAPNCRPECVVSSECAQDKACVNRKCVDPCPSTCGQNARCQVVNHNPICSCSPGYTGDPFVRCLPERKCLTWLSSIPITNHLKSTTLLMLKKIFNMLPFYKLNSKCYVNDLSTISWRKSLFVKPTGGNMMKIFVHHTNNSVQRCQSQPLHFLSPIRSNLFA